MAFRTADQVLNKVMDEADNSLTIEEKGETFIAGGTKTIATATNVEALSGTAVICNKIWIQALSTNTKPVHFATVNTVANTWPGLSAGDSAVILVKDVASVYLKVEVNGEGVSWEAIA